MVRRRPSADPGPMAVALAALAVLALAVGGTGRDGPPPRPTALTAEAPVPTVPTASTTAARPAPIALVTYSYSTAPTTTPPTTIAPIGGRIPVAPSTLPLRTKTQSTHVSPVFAALSGAGFLVALLIMAGRFIISRPSRRR